LKSGANPNLASNEGNTPLHYAVLKADVEVTSLLLDYAADPNIQNVLFKKTPLHYAVDYSYIKITKLILKRGGDTGIFDSNGRSVLALAKNYVLKNLMLNQLEVFESFIDEFDCETE
jgi:ankyrin repeat protein